MLSFAGFVALVIILHFIAGIGFIVYKISTAPKKEDVGEKS
jgi:hypothetical protein